MYIYTYVYIYIYRVSPCICNWNPQVDAFVPLVETCKKLN